MTCDYCGGEHDVYDLCRARGVSRRKFLFLGLGAAAAAVLPMPALPAAGIPTFTEYPLLVGHNTVHVRNRYMYGRVLISKEVIEANRNGLEAWAKWRQDDIAGIEADLARPDLLKQIFREPSSRP